MCGNNPDKMDEGFTRGYCQLRSETPTAERRSDQHPTFGLRGNLGPPADSCSLIYLSLILCGVGFLLPYNSFITAVDYYQAKFPGTTIIFDMSLTYICIAFVGVVINNLLVEMFSMQTRITFGFIISVLTLMFIAITDIWFDMFDKVMSYRLNLAAVGTVALGCTVQQSSFYGYTSMLPRRYTQAVMTGESAAGLMVSINRIFTKALLDNARTNTIIFFAISVATICVCCIVFHVSRHTEFVRYFVSICEQAGLSEDQHGITTQTVTNPEEVSLVDILDGNVTRDNYGVLVIQSPTTPNDDRSFSAIRDLDPHTENPAAPAMTTRQNELQIKGQGQSYRKHLPVLAGIKRGCWNRYQVARTVWPYMISIGLAYFVTLCLFPGIESEIVSCRLKSWMPILLITIFNLFDFIGKVIASVPYNWQPSVLVLATVCRILLVPLLMLCAAPRTHPVLGGEAWSMVISLLLGLSNGYFGSVPMILAPGQVPDEQKELTGNIMTLSYSIGLTTGSVVAYMLDAWLGPHPDHGYCHLTNATHTHTHNATEILKVLTSEWSIS